MSFLQQVITPVAAGPLYRDDFLTNGSTLGANWNTETSNSSCQVIALGAQVKTLFFGASETESWNSYIGGATTGHMATDSCKIRAQLKASSTTASGTSWVGIYLACPDTMSGGAKFIVFTCSTAGGSQIFAQSAVPTGTFVANGLQIGQTMLASGGGNVAATSLIELQRSAGTVLAFVNGVQTLSWTENGTVPSGATSRRWGIIGGGTFSGSQLSSPAIDWVEAYDI